MFNYINVLKTPLKWGVLNLAFLLLSSIGHAESEICQTFSEWLEWRAQRLSNDRTLPFIEIVRKERTALENSAVDLFNQYISGNLPQSVPSTCFQDPSLLLEVEPALSKAFFYQSLGKLEESSSEIANSIAKKMRNSLRRHFLPSFRLTGHFNHTGPEQGQAGVYRRTPSIFMNYKLIPNKEWLIIFVHELAHLFDNLLHDAAFVYSDDNLTKEIYRLTQKESDYRHLNIESAKRLFFWLDSGLNRGLLAEHRAWIITALVYENLLLAGEISKIQWLEEMLPVGGGNPRATEYSIFSFLDKRFTNPDSGIFSNPLVKGALIDRRQQLRSNPPGLDGVLKTFVN